MRNEVHLKTFWYGYVKMHGFHGNPIIWFSRMGGRPTNLIISRVLLTLENYDWCQIKAKTHVAFPVSDM